MATDTLDKLRRLLAHHEGAAAAIRTTLALLDGHAQAQAASNGRGVIAQAVQLDKARVKANPKSVRENRVRTAALLAALDRKVPRTIDELKAAGLIVHGRALSPLLRVGYVKKKRGGWVRTAKAFDVDRFNTRAEKQEHT